MHPRSIARFVAAATIAATGFAFAGPDIDEATVSRPDAGATPTTARKAKGSGSVTQASGTTSLGLVSGDVAEVKAICRELVEDLGRGEIDVEVGLSKVSAVGTGMKSHAGVASRMFRALADAGIPIHNITTSEIKISCIIDRPNGERGLQAVHEAFGLSAAPGGAAARRVFANET